MSKLEDIRTDCISSLRKPLPERLQHRSIAEIMSSVMRGKRITYRRYGQHGELLKPMHHRFEVKGGENHIQAMARNISAAWWAL